LPLLPEQAQNLPVKTIPMTALPLWSRDFKKSVSFFIFLFVNFIFSVKYLSRVTEYYVPISVAVVTVYVLLWKYRRLIERVSPHLKAINIFLLAVFFIGSFLVFQRIPVATLNVDRWSVITSFWDTYFAGEYAYFAKSNMGNEPGPMPFYFLLALPFYFLGELGFFSALGILAFLAALKAAKIPIQFRTLSILLLLASVFYLWEMASRSNIFVNGALVLFVLVVMFRIKEFTSTKIIFSGIMFGLAVSTRNVFVIPFLIGILYSLRSRRLGFVQFVVLGMISMAVFALTFLPFVWNHLADFGKMNPFIVQSTFLIPFAYTLGFIGMAILAGFLCKSAQDVYWYSGIVLFVSIVIYFGYHIFLSGFDKTFFDSVADISYFILCLPFAMFHFLSLSKFEI
jgi:hypothetical protein